LPHTCADWAAYVCNTQARARDEHAAEDRDNVRPKYPLMATGSREQEAVVVEVRGHAGRSRRLWW